MALARGLKLVSLFRAVRRLARLPDTADELIAVSRAIGAGDVYLREQATETRVKGMWRTESFPSPPTASSQGS